MTDYRSQVLQYFADKAQAYDEVDKQPYWRLSDALLWWLLEEFILTGLAPNAQILDAGGGTGRWAIRVLQTLPDSTVTLFDLSPDMISVAQKKAAQMGLENRLRVVEGDLNNVERELSSQSFDLVISFHNVLGFLPKPADVVRQLSSLLRPAGLLGLVVPNVYHTAYFNLSLGRIDEAESALKTKQGRFTSDMPVMNLFTPDDLAGFWRDNGLQPKFLTGFPVLIYPGYQETQLFGSTTSLKDLLGDSVAFDRIFALEQDAILHAGLAPRGNNLFLAAGRTK